MANEEASKKISSNILKNSEKSGLSEIIKEVKSSLYSVIFVLLKDEDDANFLFFAVPTAGDFLQMVQFLFNNKVAFLWNATDLFNSILVFITFFNITQYFGDIITWNIFLLMFYGYVAIIFVIIVDIIYVSISFNRKQFTSLWPLIFLRNFVNMAVTFLFLPISESLLSMIDCQFNVNAQQYVHSSYPDVICYVGTHLIHTIFSIGFTAVFVIISLIVAINYFETRMSSPNILARSNSRAEVCFIMNKIVLQLVFMVVGNTWILVLTSFFGALTLAYYYLYDDAYYNRMVAQFYKILSLLYLWSCSILVVLKILEGVDYSGGAVVWASAIPFIVIFSWGFSRNSLKTLTKNQIKFESAKELIDHTRFVLQLMEYHKKDKQSYLVLVGYMQKHKIVCPQPDCPLKVTTPKIRNLENEEKKEWETKLLQVIDRMYESGINKFRLSVRLRIMYAFFLLEKMNNKKRALEELTIAENLKPSFEDEFLIYRYKKIIDENLDEQSSGENEGEVDIVGIIAFETHLRLCVHFISKSGELQREFWMQLLEDKPNLVKLSSIGNEINFTISNAKDNWNKLYKLKSNMPSVIKLYAKFLTNIVNEKESGKKLMDQFHALVIKQHETVVLNIKDSDEALFQAPFAVLGFNRSDLGQIKKISKEFCALLGYTEEELLGHSIDQYMPQLLRQSDNNFVRMLIDGEVFESGQTEIEIEDSFVRKKNGAVIPVRITLKLFNNDASKYENMCIFNTIRPLTNATSKVFMLTNKQGVVYDVTSNALTYFNIPFTELSQRRFNIHLIIPKTALVLDKFRDRGIEASITHQKKVHKVTCVIKPWIVGPSEEVNLEGFIISFEFHPFKNKAPDFSASVKKNPMSLNADSNDIWQLLAPNLEWNRTFSQLKDHSIDKTNDLANQTLTDGVITKRLRGGNIEDLYEIKVMNEKSGDNQSDGKIDAEKSVFRESIKAAIEREEMKNNKGRKNLLIQMINKEKKSVPILLYVFFVIIWLLISVALITIAIVQSYAKYNSIGVTVSKFQNALIIIEDFSSIVSHISDIETLITQPPPSNYSSVFEVPENIEFLKAKKDSLNELVLEVAENTRLMQNYSPDIISFIIKDADFFFKEAQKFAKNSSYVTENNQFDIEVSGTEYFMSKFDFKIGRIITMTKNIMANIDKTPTLIALEVSIMKSTLLNDLIFDMMNEMQVKIVDFLDGLRQSIIINKGLYIIIIIFSAVSLMFVGYYIYLVKFVSTQTEDILILFLSIPRQDVTVIFKKCESFLQFCSVY